MITYAIFIILMALRCVMAYTNSLQASGPALYWNVSASVPLTKRLLLDKAVGCAGEGKLHALMGPSE